jgi:hypothetical protein
LGLGGFDGSFFVDLVGPNQLLGHCFHGIGQYAWGEVQEEELDTFEVILIVSGFSDKLFKVYDVLVDVGPGHAQASEFVHGPKFLLGVHELGAELGNELVIGILVIWLVSEPSPHVVPPCGGLRSFDV